MSRNSFFTGREALLREVHAALYLDEPSPRVQALTGVAGVGKTQAALEYAYRSATTSEAVFWVPADAPAGAMAGSYEFATVLAVPVRSGVRTLRSARCGSGCVCARTGWLSSTIWKTRVSGQEYRDDREYLWTLRSPPPPHWQVGRDIAHTGDGTRSGVLALTTNSRLIGAAPRWWLHNQRSQAIERNDRWVDGAAIVGGVQRFREPPGSILFLDPDGASGR